MQIDIPLTAVNCFGRAVHSHNCQDRTDFINRDKELIITEYEDGTGVVVKTSLGEYQLPKHKTMNVYKGTCKGHKVQIHLKKMVGTFTYHV